MVCRSICFLPCLRRRSFNGLSSLLKSLTIGFYCSWEDVFLKYGHKRLGSYNKLFQRGQRWSRRRRGGGRHRNEQGPEGGRSGGPPGQCSLAGRPRRRGPVVHSPYEHGGPPERCNPRNREPSRPLPSRRTSTTATAWPPSPPSSLSVPPWWTHLPTTSRSTPSPVPRSSSQVTMPWPSPPPGTQQLLQALARWRKLGQDLYPKSKSFRHGYTAGWASSHFLAWFRASFGLDSGLPSLVWAVQVGPVSGPVLTHGMLQLRIGWSWLENLRNFWQWVYRTG